MRAKVSQEIKENIDNLFGEASINRTKARSLVKKARKLARRANYRIPEKWLDKFCHKCDSWFNSKNVKIRLSHKKISRKCLTCGYFSRKKFKNV